MPNSVPLSAGPVLGIIGKATLNEENKVTAIEFDTEYEKVFRKDFDKLYTYVYNELPEPHILMRPIPFRSRNR